jgi:putative component of membrane protein insertase Oxa1/YidC/SpoIIIJ protein YidD
MSHNVSAVYDVLAARISKCVAFAYPGGQNVPEQRRGNEAKWNDLVVAEAEPATAGEA